MSTLFDRKAGTFFPFTVQAHGIADQTDVNADSWINDEDLVEGGQLLFLTRGKKLRAKLCRGGLALCIGACLAFLFDETRRRCHDLRLRPLAMLHPALLSASL